VDLVRLSDRLVPRRDCAFCLFPALQFHRFLCRRCLRLLLASTVTFSENDSLPDCLDDESFVMFRSGLRKDFINGAPRRNALQQFLQMPLGLISTGSSASCARSCCAWARINFLVFSNPPSR